MTEALETKLIQAYPLMFQRHGGDPRETCMAFGIEHGDGWYPILHALCSSIANYEALRVTGKSSYLTEGAQGGSAAYEPVVFEQIKEKFGTIRIYYSGGDHTVHNLVGMAESMSDVTCEGCGSTAGTVKTNGWITTSCPACLSKDGRGTQEFAACAGALPNV